MKQITQKELIKLLEKKQEDTKNMFYSTKDSEKDLDKAQLMKVRYLGEMDAYQTIICKLIDAEIVPEEQIVTTIPKAKQEELGITQEDLKKMIKKTPITPYNEQKIEPLRDDRFKEYVDRSCTSHYIDAKEICYIRIDHGKDCVFIVLSNAEVIKIDKDILDYNELVAWWKYWKEQE